MDCKRIRQLLLADYPDRELGPGPAKEVKEHLQGCAACRAFEQAVVQKAISPFKNAPELKAPDAVWEKIQQAIDRTEQPQEQFAFPAWLKGKFDALFAFPRPAYALATLMSAILVFMLIANSPAVKQAQLEKFFSEEADFISSLDNDVDANGLGALTEEIFS
jgi:anti-sigma factor RsiW